MTTNIDLASQRLNVLENPSVIKEMIDNSSVQHLKSIINLLDNGIVNFVNNPTYNSNRVITFLADQAVILDQMYVICEYTVTSNAASLGNGVQCQMFPNSILNMIQALTFTTNAFSYQLNSANSYRTIPLWGNIQRIQEYTYDDMLLNSSVEDMNFIAGPQSLIQGTNAYGTNQVVLTQSTFDLNKGKVINVGPQGSVQTKFYTKIPLSKLIPLTNRLHLLSGQINLNMTFFYDPTLVFSNSQTITEFSLTRLMLHHDILKFIAPNPTLDVRQITSLAMKSFRSSPPVSLGLATGSAVRASVDVSFIAPQIGSQCFKIVICPRIEPSSNAVYTYKGDALSTSTFNPSSNSGISNCLCLGTEWSLTNVQVKVGGIVLPSNIQPMYLNSIDADLYNYQFSIVQNQGLNTDGSSTRCCIPFNAYKSYFKVLIVDLENLTQNNLGNTQFDISYTISTAVPLNVTVGGNVNFTSDIFLTYATEYTNF